MTKTLQTMLGRADEIGAAKTELNTRRNDLRALKEKVFEEAGSNDSKAFARVGELGAQENLLTIQIERLDRELAGLSVSLLNEAAHVRRAVAKAGQIKREKFAAKISAALEQFVPDPKNRDWLVRETCKLAPEAQLLAKLAFAPAAFDPHSSDQVRFARGTLNLAERAIAQCGL